MSDNTIRGPGMNAPSAAAEAGRPVAIESGVVMDETPVSQPREKDSFGRDAMPKEKPSVRDDGTTRRAGQNPFAKLARRAVPMPPPRQLVSARVVVDIDIDIPLPTLARAAAAEAKLGPERTEAFAKLREGLMLVATDAQANQDKKTPLDQAALRRLASALVDKRDQNTRDAITAGLKLQARFFAGIKRDIHAFVQRVLRECYLIQSELLWDYAAKVKHYNELKKRVREKLEKMRPVHSAWAEENRRLGTDVTFYSDDPIPYEVLDDNGVWHQDTMTEDDVQSWVPPQDANEGSASTGGSTLGTVRSEYQQLRGASKLTYEDEVILDVLIAKSDDDPIKDELEAVCDMLTRMNAHDLETYIVPFLDELRGGNTDEREILELYSAMDPCQFMYMTTLGYEEERVDLHGGDAREFVVMARAAGNAIAQALGREFSEFDTGGGDSEQRREVTGPEARRLLEALGAAVNAEATAEAEAQARADAIAAGDVPEGWPEIGSPKVLRTAEEVENYIELLEEKLNSIGDDAQLANVDLQNALQRQQQTLQMMSNISKMLHDTTLSVVRKISQ